VHAALGNGEEAAGMRREVQAKVMDVREVVDETLAKAAGRSAVAHSKVDELKAQVLAQWHEADRCVCPWLTACALPYGTTAWAA